MYAPGSSILEAAGAKNIDLNGKKSAFSFSLLKNLAKLIRQEKPDILQANGSDTLKYAVFVKMFYFPKLPIVYRNISMVSSWSGAGSLKTKFNQLLFKKVNMVTSVGQKPLDDLIALYKFPVSHARLIRRGIPAMVFENETSRISLAGEFGFSVNDPLVLHVGQFSDEKNHGFLVDAFSKVIQQIPNARLVMVGEGKNIEAIKKLIIENKFDQHIFLAGHRSPVQEILAAADVFILGSTIEGIPGVILEAGMQRVPAVAVNVGGVGEVVRMNKTGILIEKHDAFLFSDAIIHILQDEAKRKNLGLNAYEFVMDNYSLQSCLKNFEKLYTDVLNPVFARNGK